MKEVKVNWFTGPKQTEQLENEIVERLFESVPELRAISGLNDEGFAEIARLTAAIERAGKTGEYTALTETWNENLKRIMYLMTVAITLTGAAPTKRELDLFSGQLLSTINGALMVGFLAGLGYGPPKVE